MSFEMAKNDSLKSNSYWSLIDFSLIIDITIVNKINYKFILKKCIYVC